MNKTKFTDDQIGHLKQYIHGLTPGLAGKFFYYCIPFRKKVVLDNMHQAFGGVLSAAEIKKLALGFYAHVAKSLKENILMRFMSLRQIKNKAEIKGAGYLYELVGHDVNGAIILTGHFGNWEFAPIAGILNFTEYQHRFYFVRKLLAAK